MNTTLCERKRGTEKKLEKENEMDKKKKRRLGHGVVDEIFAVGWCKCTCQNSLDTLFYRHNDEQWIHYWWEKLKHKLKQEWCVPLFSIYI